MSLVEHARRELERIGEDADVIDWYCRVIAEFASFGHSGGSAMATIPVLHDLLRFRPLSPLTDDPSDSNAGATAAAAGRARASSTHTGSPR